MAERHTKRVNVTRDGRTIYRDDTPWYMNIGNVEPVYDPDDGELIGATYVNTEGSATTMSIGSYRSYCIDSGTELIVNQLKWKEEMEKKEEGKSVKQKEREILRQLGRYDDREKLARARITARQKQVLSSRVGIAFTVPVVLTGAAVITFFSTFLGIVVMALGLFFMIGFMVVGANQQPLEGKHEDGRYKDPLMEIAYITGQKRELNEKLEDIYLEDKDII